MSEILVAVITGLVAGGLSSLSTVASLRVHIQYIKEAIDKHDKRLRAVELEQRSVATAVGAEHQNIGAAGR